MKKICTFLSLTLLIGLYACGDGGSDTKSNKESKEDKEKTAKKTEQNADENMEDVELILPGSVHIGEIFKKAGLKYVKGATNDPANVSDYNTKTDKLLNYGVYSADLTYSALNGQSQKASEYLKVIKRMTDEIGYSEIFSDEELINRFEENIDDRDAVIDLLVELQEKTDDFMDDNAIKNESVVIFTGGWIEGMYLGVQASNLNEQDKINKRLVEQMAILNDLLGVLDPLSSRVSDLEPLVQELNELNKMYRSAKEDGSEDENIGLSDLKKIADKVVAVRNSIV